MLATLEDKARRPMMSKGLGLSTCYVWACEYGNSVGKSAMPSGLLSPKTLTEPPAACNRLGDTDGKQGGRLEVCSEPEHIQDLAIEEP